MVYLVSIPRIHGASMVPQQAGDSELAVSMHGIWLTLGAMHATKLGRIITSAHALLVRVTARAHAIRLVTLLPNHVSAAGRSQSRCKPVLTEKWVSLHPSSANSWLLRLAFI